MDDPVSVTSLLLVARALYLGSGMLLVNATVFRWLILAPALAPGPGDAAPLFFRDRLRAVFLIASVLLVVGAVLWFWAVTAEMNGTTLSDALDHTAWSTVLFQTRFGLVSEVRLGLFALLGALAWNFYRANISPTRARLLLEISTCLAAAALLASVSWTAHAGSTGGNAFPWTLIADSIHLLAGTVWPTGLLFFAWILSSALAHKDLASASAIIAIARRFSAVSLVAVLVLALTGTVEACFIVRSFGAMVTTDYGRVLCLKIAVFGAMLAIAAWNRFRLLPRLRDGERDQDSAPTLAILHQLRRFVRIELALAAGIIAIVALLGTLPPPR